MQQVAGSRQLRVASDYDGDGVPELPASPRVTRVFRNSGDFAALRYDALGGRVYALSAPSSAGGPIFDLRGSTITKSGTHTLGAWVARHDGVGVSARRNGPRVEVAEVVR